MKIDSDYYDDRDVDGDGDGDDDDDDDMMICNDYLLEETTWEAGLEGGD